MSNPVSSASSAPVIPSKVWDQLQEEIFHNMLSSLEFRDLANTQVVNQEWNRKTKSYFRPFLIQKIEALLSSIGSEEIKRFEEMEYHLIHLEDLFKSLLTHCPKLAQEKGELFQCRHLLAEKAAEKDPEDALYIYRVLASKDLSDQELCAIAEKLGPLDFGEAEEVARKIKSPGKQREALARLIPFADPEKTEGFFQECLTGEGKIHEEPIILNYLLINCPSKKDVIIARLKELNFESDQYSSFSSLWLPMLATTDFDAAKEFIDDTSKVRSSSWNAIYDTAKKLQASGQYEHAQAIMRRAKEQIDQWGEDLDERYFPPFPFLLKHDPQKTAQALLEETGLVKSLDNLEEPKCEEFIDNFGQTKHLYHLEMDPVDKRFELLMTKKICSYYLGKIILKELKHALYQNVCCKGHLSVSQHYHLLFPLEAFADVAWVLKVTENLYPEQKVFYYLKALEAQSRIQETARGVICETNNNNN